MNATGIRLFHLSTYESLQSVFPKLQTTCREKHGLVFTFHQRLKSEKSIQAKLDKKESIDDVIGFRILNPWASELHRLVKILETEFKQFQIHIERTEITERDRVIHMYCEFNEIPFEIQFWPSLMYYCFEYEHSRFYKVDHPTHRQKFRAQTVRNQEHKLQDLIDDNVLVPYEKNIGITLDVEEQDERGL